MKLMEVAEGVDPRLPLALTLAESTGRRIGAIVKLRRDDLDLDRLPYGWLRFRAEHDKTGREQWVPLTQAARGVVLRQLAAVPSGEWLFPAERNSEKSVGVSAMSQRLRAAYEKAKLPRLEGGSGTHGAGSGRRSGRGCRSRTWPRPAAGRIRRRSSSPTSRRTRRRSRR